MKEYLKKNGIKLGAVVLVAAVIIGLGAAARGGEIGFLQDVSGILEAPVKKVLSSAVNWFNTIYGHLFEYDELVAEK